MTKEEFKQRWNSDKHGGGITFGDIADCAQKWGICSNPRCHNIWEIRNLVLRAANCSIEGFSNNYMEE